MNKTFQWNDWNSAHLTKLCSSEKLVLPNLKVVVWAAIQETVWISPNWHREMCAKVCKSRVVWWDWLYQNPGWFLRANTTTSKNKYWRVWSTGEYKQFKTSIEWCCVKTSNSTEWADGIYPWESSSFACVALPKKCFGHVWAILWAADLIRIRNWWSERKQQIDQLNLGAISRNSGLVITQYTFTKIAADFSITPSRIASETQLNGKTCFDAQRGVTQNQ